MSFVIVLDNPKDWPLDIEGVEVVSAKNYLTEPRFIERKGAKVFNLCKSYRYQSLGYYVSLLAAARGHKPLPDISTIQDLKLSELIRAAGDDLDELIQPCLAPLKSDTFVLSIYFGRNLAKKYDRLALALFNAFPAPFLRAQFRASPDSEGKRHWRLESIRPVDADEIPADHFLFVVFAATQYFTRPQRRSRPADPRYDLAILVNPGDEKCPSNEKALKKFEKAAESMGFGVEFITRDDAGKIAEFDALFIRETTAVNHHTFRCARRAASEGLVVIDDPDSIVKCSNKVYLHELMVHNKLAVPKTLVLHKGNWESAPQVLGLPIVLKQPDSSFSLGVNKVDTQQEFEAAVEKLFKISDLLIAQEFTPTDFDWRVGVLDKEPLYACKYFMAGKHWQIYDNTKKGEDAMGNFETWPVAALPPDVLKTAVKAANLIGDGLYGVDVKEIKGRASIIEINDNPNIDAGVEDKVLGDEIYNRVIRSFLRRLESKGR